MLGITGYVLHILNSHTRLQLRREQTGQADSSPQVFVGVT